MCRCFALLHPFRGATRWVLFFIKRKLKHALEATQMKQNEGLTVGFGLLTIIL